jgi:hypothetical protein
MVDLENRLYLDGRHCSYTTTTVAENQFSEAVRGSFLKRTATENMIFGDGYFYRTVSRKDKVSETVLLREPRLKSDNRSGVLSQPPPHVHQPPAPPLFTLCRSSTLQRHHAPT